MVGSFGRLAAAAAFCAVLAGCTSVQDIQSTSPQFTDTAVTTPDSPLQCVPYARERSRIAIYGDATTWWQTAQGRFARGAVPAEGAVMVLHDYGGPKRAHLAVVTKITDTREIRVDHANWLSDGAIYLNDPVRDVSPDNDWSLVRVFNLRTGSWGIKTYRVQGFIGPDLDNSTMRVARSPAPKNDAIAGLLSSDPDLEDEIY